MGSGRNQFQLHNIKNTGTKKPVSHSKLDPPLQASRMLHPD